MDVIAKIDRTLLDNELRNLVRFRMSRDSDRALFKPTYKIEIDDSCPYFIIRELFFVVPYDDTNRKFILISETHVLEIERFTNNTLSIRSANCMDPYKWHTFTSYSNPKTFTRIHTIYEACLKEYKNYNYEEGSYNYEKYVKSL